MIGEAREIAGSPVPLLGAQPEETSSNEETALRPDSLLPRSTRPQAAGRERLVLGTVNYAPRAPHGPFVLLTKDTTDDPHIIREFAEPLDLSKLCGRTLETRSQDDGYWHESVAFQTADGGSIIFTTTEHVAGHWFEVFPIQYAIEASPGKLKASQDEAIADRHGTVAGLQGLASDEAHSMARLVRQALDDEAAVAERQLGGS